MLGLRRKILNRIDKRVSEYCYHELKHIKEVKNAQGVFNFKCFDNAVQYASKREGYEVVMGFYQHMNENHCSLHFWCRKDGVDYEVSTGYKCSYYYYYEIKVIPKESWKAIGSIFDDGLAYYKDKLTTTFEKIVLLGGRIV